jgi:formylglycine-generating enzyme required for sulfatase activity
MRLILTEICIILAIAPVFGCNDANPVLDDDREDIDTEEMVFIPAGEFLMGSSAQDVQRFLIEFIYRRPSRFADEQPQHTVYLDAFYIDKYEVTNAQYKRFLHETGCKPPTSWNNDSYSQPDQAVMAVNWEDAAAYAKWAGKRLPTEAEWEKGPNHAQCQRCW